MDGEQQEIIENSESASAAEKNNTLELENKDCKDNMDEDGDVHKDEKDVGPSDDVANGNNTKSVAEEEDTNLESSAGIVIDVKEITKEEEDSKDDPDMVDESKDVVMEHKKDDEERSDGDATNNGNNTGL